jgi:hypothetical protein
MKCRGNVAALVLLILWGFGLFAQSASAQSKDTPVQKSGIKRLILKDGSYELATQYSIQEDRVRYYSAERYEWEELPKSMIDWDATEEYAREAAGEVSSRMNTSIAQADRERREVDARTPLVAPGLRLPSADGVFLLDVYQGKPELNSLSQDEADLKKNMKENILRGAINPVAGSKQTIELSGLHAKIQSHDLSPVLYFSIDTSDASSGYTAESAKNFLRMVRCETKKGNRIVAVMKIAVYGKVDQKAQYVETRVEAVSDYWVKISPAAPLKPGEYALVEIDAKGSMNEFVWDFGVNPAAPPNPAMMPASSERKEPVLIQKPPNNRKPSH